VNNKAITSKFSGGFSLIELMIVLIIVAVLMLVALPAYQSFVVKANRAEAKAYLLDMAQRQQLFFNDSRTYAEDEAELHMVAPERVAKNYAISFEVQTIDPPPTWTIKATPIDGTRQQGDGVLSIDYTGDKKHGTEAW